jgi:hypothetical protein
MKFTTYLFPCIILLISCSEKNNSNSNNHIDFDSIIENDTLSFKSIHENLNSWLGYYKKTDTLFTLSNFKASGVILHMSTLIESDTNKLSNLKLKPLFEYSPDGSVYIDLW